MHKSDCPNVIAGMKRDNDRDRFVSAWWEAGAEWEKSTFEAFIQVYCKDNIGLLANISVALADMRVSIISISSQKCQGNSTILNISISCKNTEHVNSIVSRIKSIDGVVDVVRGFA